jgi:hypothetical protein
MQGITVKLQDNYSYLPFLLLLFAVITGVILLVVWASKGPKAEKKAVKNPVQPPVNPRSRMMELKRKYDRLLIQLADESEKELISERETYQRLSRLVRDFVYEMTGVKVQNYTLQELREMNMPKLTALIEECYVPEFALDNCRGDVKETIKKARKVIGEWI